VNFSKVLDLTLKAYDIGLQCGRISADKTTKLASKLLFKLVGGRELRRNFSSIRASYPQGWDAKPWAGRTGCQVTERTTGWESCVEKD
jgi:hypothetical protein